MGRKLFPLPKNIDVLEEKNAKEHHLRMTSGAVLVSFSANGCVGQKMQLWPAFTPLYS